MVLSLLLCLYFYMSLSLSLSFDRSCLHQVCCVLICLIRVSFETRKRLKLVTTFSPDSLNLNSHNNLVMPWIESGYLTYFQKCLRLTLSVSFGHIMAPHHSDPMSKRSKRAANSYAKSVKSKARKTSVPIFCKFLHKRRKRLRLVTTAVKA